MSNCAIEIRFFFIIIIVVVVVVVVVVVIIIIIIIIIIMCSADAIKVRKLKSLREHLSAQLTGRAYETSKRRTRRCNDSTFR